MAVRMNWVPVVIAYGMTGSLAAQESEAPDLSFLEFLGSWEDGDEWFVFAGLADDEFAVVTDEDVIVGDGADGAENADDTDAADEADETVEPDDAREPDERQLDEGTDEAEATDDD
jgi:hypothetical protein